MLKKFIFLVRHCCMKTSVNLKNALYAWLGAVAVVVLLPLLVLLVINLGFKVSRNPMLTNWMDFYLFIGTSYLLFIKRIKADVRLAMEIAIWLATANSLVFKHVSGPISFVIVCIAVVIAFGVAFWRGSKAPVE